MYFLFIIDDRFYICSHLQNYSSNCINCFAFFLLSVNPLKLHLLKFHLFKWNKPFAKFKHTNQSQLCYSVRGNFLLFLSLKKLFTFILLYLTFSKFSSFSSYVIFFCLFCLFLINCLFLSFLMNCLFYYNFGVTNWTFGGFRI